MNNAGALAAMFKGNGAEVWLHPRGGVVLQVVRTSQRLARSISQHLMRVAGDVAGSCPSCANPYYANIKRG